MNVEEEGGGDWLIRSHLPGSVSGEGLLRFSFSLEYFLRLGGLRNTSTDCPD